jgi:hypothetical protein
MQELPSMAKFHGIPPGLATTNHSTKSNQPMTSAVLAGIERWPLERLIPHARNARTTIRPRIPTPAQRVSHI